MKKAPIKKTKAMNRNTSSGSGGVLPLTELAASGSVANPPDSPRQPSGYYFDRIESAASDQELEDIDAELDRHGYDPAGKLRTFIAQGLGR